MTSGIPNGISVLPDLIERLREPACGNTRPLRTEAADALQRLTEALDDILAVAEFDGIRMHMIASAALEPSDD